MIPKLKPALLSAIGIWLVLLAAVACQGNPSPEPTQLPTLDPRGRPDAAVTGTVTYREPLTLTSDARLVVEIWDVSLIEPESKLIARQEIPNPGQVPIEYQVEYHRQDIVPKSTYAINARIIEADFSLAFISAAAHEVITHGNPDKVDLVLAMVPPALDPAGDSGAGSSVQSHWVALPVPVIEAKSLRWNDQEQSQMLRIERDLKQELMLDITFQKSNIAACATRDGGLQVDGIYKDDIEVNGFDIFVEATLKVPRPAWAIPCLAGLQETETFALIEGPFTPDQTYRVIVNGLETTTFTLPEPDFPDSFFVPSPIESIEVMTLESAPPQYELRIVSGLPKGGSCSRFNGYEIRRAVSTRIDVAVTHHEVADPDIVCTADYPIVETSVPLGFDFRPGVEYTVGVNSDITETFVAQ